MAEAALVASALRWQVVRYAQAASLTLLALDWVTCFTREVEFIWLSRWSVTKILYLLSRYSPFIDTPINVIYYLTPNLNYNTCHSLAVIASWSTAAGLALSELILLTRTYALYRSTRTVLVTLSVLWIVWILGNIPVLVLYSRSLKFGPSPLPHMPGCYGKNSNPGIFGSFVSLLLFEILIIVMTANKAMERRNQKQIPILTLTLYRDGILYFSCLFVCTLSIVVLLATAPREYADLMDPFTRVFHSLICCRILLNLRIADRMKGVAAVSVGLRQAFALAVVVPGHASATPSSPITFYVNAGLPPRQLGDEEQFEPSPGSFRIE